MEYPKGRDAQRRSSSKISDPHEERRKGVTHNYTGIIPSIYTIPKENICGV